MPCISCGAPGYRRSCPTCTRGRDRARGTTTERGYGAEHQRLRAAWQERIDDGELVLCPRCGEPVEPGMEWDLGHSDDRNSYSGPEHSRECNRAAGGRAAHGR